MLQNRLFFALASRSGFGATISDAVAGSSIVFCNSVSADRIVMAASRLLRAVAAFVILLSFAAGSRKSSWSGCMKCEAWSVKEAVGSEKCEVWSVKCEVWSVKFEVWSVKFEVWSAKSAVCSVRCGVSREGHGRDRLSLNYRSFMFGKLPPPACPGLCDMIRYDKIW